MSGHGRFTWYDLMTSDPVGSTAFYSALVGWKTKGGGGTMPYSMWTCGGMPLGGLMELPKAASDAGAPPHWLAYVGVDDVDATVARAKELEAMVFVEPDDIPDTGRFAVLADPQGAMFAVFSSSSDALTDGGPGMGRFSWHELMAEDHEAAFSFYSDLFGWRKIEAHDMGELGVYQTFGREEGEPPMGGLFTKPEDMPALWLLYIEVENVQTALSRVAELGGEVLNGPMEVPGGNTIGQCLDPQGALFALHSTPTS